jgi:hypothetical protein
MRASKVQSNGSVKGLASVKICGKKGLFKGLHDEGREDLLASGEAGGVNL